MAGLALVQSPFGGSPIASDILREGQIADKEARRIMEFIVCKLIKVLSSSFFFFSLYKPKQKIKNKNTPCYLTNTLIWFN